MSYGGDLASDMSRDARKCFDQSRRISGLRTSDDRDRVDSWSIADHKGGLTASGLGGSITGRGAHLLVIDDYLKNRQDAESQLIRERQWDSFRNDLLTRLAPVHIIIIIATR